MPCLTYETKNFQRRTLRSMQQAQTIIEEFQRQGYTLTLRQLYYQMVARDLIPNEQSAYNRIGRIVNDGRMAGLIDWQAIEDRTRSLDGNAHWEDPESILEGSAKQYRIDMWADQPRRVECWVEKDALVGVLERSCSRLDIDFFSCRGYTSQSAMWRAARRLFKYAEGGQPVTILHLGDHDPSGIDMTRDIEERLQTFLAQDYMRAHGLDRVDQGTVDDMVQVKRIALNQDQIERYQPPPNPAKTTDSRFESYMKRYGFTSWELDALEPSVLDALVTEEVEALRDDERWEDRQRRQEDERGLLEELCDNLDDVKAFLSS